MALSVRYRRAQISCSQATGIRGFLLLAILAAGVPGRTDAVVTAAGHVVTSVVGGGATTRT